MRSKLQRSDYLEDLQHEWDTGESVGESVIAPGSAEHIASLAECITRILPDMGYDARADHFYALARQEAQANGILEHVAQMVTIGLMVSEESA